MSPWTGIWRRTRTDEDLDQDESHRLTFRSIVWMSGPPLLGSNLVSARHPVPCSQRYTLSVFQVFQAWKIPDPMRCCGTYFVIFPNQGPSLNSLDLFCLFQWLQNKIGTIVDFLRILRMYQNLFMQGRKTQRGGFMIVAESNGSIVTIVATISAPVSTDKTISITHLAITITAR